MSGSFALPQPRLRVLHRKSMRPPATMSVRAVRPSILDLRLRGDPSVVSLSDGTLALYFDQCCLVGLAGSNLDVPSLNQWLERLRRLPRRRS